MIWDLLIIFRIKIIEGAVAKAAPFLFMDAENIHIKDAHMRNA